MSPRFPESQAPPQSQDQPTAALSRVEQARVSRRSLLRGAAGAGAIGIAAAGGAGAVVALTRPAEAGIAKPAAKPVAIAPMAPNAMAGPLVMYLRDTSTGEIDVFAGTGETRLNDPALVRSLLQALK